MQQNERTRGSLPRYCMACGGSSPSFGPGPGGRPGASCPHCGSLERHRFLALLLDGLGPWLAGARLVLDVAPSHQTATRLQSLCPTAHVRVDFDPAADGRAVDVQASITDLPFGDGVVDALVCYHVLEHVPDDAAAIAEIARVLRDGGCALVQVPWRPGRPTDEDPSLPREERIRRFGQADHVRYYGGDVDARFQRAGLDVVRVTPHEVFGSESCQVLGLVPSETVWVLRRGAGGPGRYIETVDRLRNALAPMVSMYAAAAAETPGVELQAQLQQAQAAAERWELAYRRLRRVPPIRLAAAVSRWLRLRR